MVPKRPLVRFHPLDASVSRVPPLGVLAFTWDTGDCDRRAPSASASLGPYHRAPRRQLRLVDTTTLDDHEPGRTGAPLRTGHVCDQRSNDVTTAAVTVGAVITIRAPAWCAMAQSLAIAGGLGTLTAGASPMRRGTEERRRGRAVSTPACRTRGRRRRTRGLRDRSQLGASAVAEPRKKANHVAHRAWHFDDDAEKPGSVRAQASDLDGCAPG